MRKTCPYHPDSYRDFTLEGKVQGIKKVRESSLRGEDLGGAKRKKEKILPLSFPPYTPLSISP